MIDLYFWTTPNGYKITIALEEMGLPYKVVPIDITAGAQYGEAFTAISPNNKIPAIVDHDGPDGRDMAVFESGAILIYLAEKAGTLLPRDARGRMQVLAWLMFQVSSMGPMLGQTHHFRRYAPDPIPYAIERYTNEATRLYKVIDDQLARNEYLAGSYSIADIAAFPWIRPWKRWQGQDIDQFPHLKRWFEAMGERPGVQRGLAVLAESRKWEAKPGTQEWKNMFKGSTS